MYVCWGVEVSEVSVVLLALLFGHNVFFFRIAWLFIAFFFFPIFPFFFRLLVS